MIREDIKASELVENELINVVAFPADAWQHQQHIRDVVKAMQEIVDNTRRVLDATQYVDTERLTERLRQNVTTLDQIVERLR